MATILIGTRQPLPILRQEIELEFFRQGLDKMSTLVCEEKQIGRHGFLEMTLVSPEDETLSAHFDDCLSELVSHSLLGLVSREFLEHVARTEYPLATKDEIALVISSSRHILQTDVESGYRDAVRGQVAEFLNEHRYINLEGFLRFRLKDYFTHLREIAEQALESFLAEKEYREFIRLLRYFVENQEPKVVEVHVVIYTQDLFRLLDEDGKPLEPEYLRGILGDLSDNELNYEDLLLSALITLSPRRLVIHQAGTIDIAKTIDEVFRERVIHCEGCELCMKSFSGVIPGIPR